MAATNQGPRRIGQWLYLKPESIEAYKECHAAVWPEVLEQIKDSNICDCKLISSTFRLYASFPYLASPVSSINPPEFVAFASSCSWPYKSWLHLSPYQSQLLPVYYATPSIILVLFYFPIRLLHNPGPPYHPNSIERTSHLSIFFFFPYREYCIHASSHTCSEAHHASQFKPHLKSCPSHHLPYYLTGLVQTSLGVSSFLQRLRLSTCSHILISMPIPLLSQPPLPPPSALTSTNTPLPCIDFADFCLDSIFLSLSPRPMLFASFKYTGSSFDADMARMAANPKVQEWWRMTDGMQ